MPSCSPSAPSVSPPAPSPVSGLRSPVSPHPAATQLPAPVPHETILENGAPVDVFPEDCRVTILSPTYGDVTTEYLESYATIREHCRARFRRADGSIALLPIVAGRIGCLGDSHVDRARNVTANIWAKDNPHRTRFGYWWDVDIPVGPAEFLELWRLALLGYRFFGGIYACKNIIPTFIANVKSTGGAPIKPDPQGMIEVLHLGTGSMMWDRSVLTALESHPEVKPYVCAPNTPWPWRKFHAYFSSGVYGPPENIPANVPNAEPHPQWQSEDWKVCMLWQELGGKVWAAQHIKLRHKGTLVYPPQVADLQTALETMLRQHHPAVNIERLRPLVEQYRKAA